MKHSADPYVPSARANQKRQRSEQRAFVIDSGLEHQTADQASEQEPMLPKGYLHIRSAIRALLSAETDLQGMRERDRSATYPRSGSHSRG